MASRKNPISRKDNVVVQEMNGEVLIYDLQANKAFCLNETSALVWEMCDGSKDVSALSKSLSEKLNSPANEDLVWLALDQLKKENLISNAQEITPDFNGMSRRDVIKKVGLGTMIALPVVSSLVAPTAAHAQSGSAGVGQACTDPKDCAPCANGNKVQCRNNNAVCPTGTAKCCDCS